MQRGVRRWAVAVDVYARIRDDIVARLLAGGAPLVEVLTVRGRRKALLDEHARLVDAIDAGDARAAATAEAHIAAAPETRLEMGRRVGRLGLTWLPPGADLLDLLLITCHRPAPARTAGRPEGSPAAQRRNMPR